MRELVNLGVEVHAVMPPGGSLIDMYKKFGVIVHEHDISFTFNPLKMRRTILFLRYVVEKYNPDIIHSHFVITTIFMRLALRQNSKIPRVFQVPGPMHLEYYLFRRIELALANKNDHWIASCEWTRNCYKRLGIDPARIYFSYYGVDIDSFFPRKTNNLRKELNLSRDVKLVGIVAFMYAPRAYLCQKRGNKGHEDLIDAIAICRSRGLNIKCIMVGGAWAEGHRYEERVRRYAERRCGDAVVCLGTRGDVPDLYPDFDIVVHPSHSENVGGAVESLLLGRPTITTNVGGLPDLVKDGETGWLVPPKSPKALADKIEYALTHYDEAARLAENGKRLCMEMFDIRKNARDVFDAYRNILARYREQ